MLAGAILAMARFSPYCPAGECMNKQLLALYVGFRREGKFRMECWRVGRPEGQKSTCTGSIQEVGAGGGEACEVWGSCSMV